MYYIVTALYCEAKPWIERFGLKSLGDAHGLRIFKSEEAILAVTGTGKLAAAIGVTELLTRFPPGGSSVLINAGICAAGPGTEKGSLRLCAEIGDSETGRLCYPDIITKPPVSFGRLLTVSDPYRGSGEESGACHENGISKESGSAPSDRQTLYDMEAYGVYTAASRWFPQHRMIFFKTVSDYGSEEAALTDKAVTELVAQSVDEIIDYADRVTEIDAGMHSCSRLMSEETRERLARLAEEMHCSETMKRELLSLVNYMRLKGTDPDELWDALEANLRENPCKNKNEAKKLLLSIREGDFLVRSDLHRGEGESLSSHK